MRQLQLFTTAELARMRDRTASRSYSPQAEDFRREHERHRAWGLPRRHADRLRRLRERISEPPSMTAASAAPETPDQPAKPSCPTAPEPPDQSTNRTDGVRPGGAHGVEWIPAVIAAERYPSPRPQALAPPTGRVPPENLLEADKS
jgi:hypothetical protein